MTWWFEITYEQGCQDDGAGNYYCYEGYTYCYEGYTGQWYGPFSANIRSGPGGRVLV